MLPKTQSLVCFAEIYTQMRRQGTPVDDIDLLVAGVALVHDWVLVTHNTKHFGKIPNLPVKDWNSEPHMDKAR